MNLNNKASTALIAIIAIVIIIIAAGLTYYFLNPPNSSEVKILNEYHTYEGMSKYIINVEVINHGKDGDFTVIAEKEEYKKTETLECRISLRKNEKRFLTFEFCRDPYVYERQTPPTPTPTLPPIPPEERDPDEPESYPEPTPPINTRVWTVPS